MPTVSPIKSENKPEASKDASASNSTSKKRGEYNFAAGGSNAPKAKKAKKRNNAKRTGNAKNSARSASNNASKAASNAASTIDLGLASISRTSSNAARQTANTVNDSVERGSKAIRGAFANASNSAKQISDRVSNIGKEISGNLSKAANRASQTTNSALELSRENAAALSESYATTVKALRKASSDIAQNANAQFAENIEAARQALSTRSISEFFALANKQARRNFEAAVQNATKISEVVAGAAALALEPINEQASRNSKKIAQIIA